MIQIKLLTKDIWNKHNTQSYNKEIFPPVKRNTNMLIKQLTKKPRESREQKQIHLKTYDHKDKFLMLHISRQKQTFC